MKLIKAPQGVWEKFEKRLEERKELWRNIPRFRGYSISSLGRIRRKLKTGRFHYLIPQKEPNTGYWRIGLTKGGKQQQLSLHKIVLICFSTESVCTLAHHLRLTVNHKDGNKDNNKISNLEWMTQSENNCHAIKLGLRKILRGTK